MLYIQSKQTLNTKKSSKNNRHKKKDTLFIRFGKT